MSNNAANEERYARITSQTARTGSPASALTTAKHKANGRTAAAARNIAGTGSRADGGSCHQQSEIQNACCFAYRCLSVAIEISNSKVARILAAA